MKISLKAPFPYFGGKSSVANKVWQALGTPKHYIEPFFGSGAVLLLRPGYQQTMIETVCDADVFLCNVWRSLQFNPNETSKWCDWPVNHADLSARKKELIKNEERLLENLIKDTEWYDAKLAGYWIWAASCWIGSGLTKIGQRPHVSNGGKGVHALGQIPHVSDGGKGVHAMNNNIYKWFNELSERLRHVRVVCGDWTRICGGNWQDKMGVCGIFFDPPYSKEAGRNNDLYHKESETVAHDVSEWALKRGGNKNYRIVIAGYEEEHKWLLQHGWKIEHWSANGGYSNLANKDSDESNRHKESLFYSPYCLGQRQLF